MGVSGRLDVSQLPGPTREEPSWLWFGAIEEILGIVAQQTDCLASRFISRRNLTSWLSLGGRLQRPGSELQHEHDEVIGECLHNGHFTSIGTA
ncbi:hypothetical protein CLCR_02673 [Cladophialophora carrionii]|uniref:Uncharacterized protein n=1 Tax=Cladophialophora carrionii TaxID=86049 RepID=A0A1C1CF63_9EURO|nr:hypothetical protein CLCR_02673 [Cladophialophora carrionii]